MGWVCLFDFESAREEDYGRTHHLWSDFFLSHKPKRGLATIVLKLNRLRLAHKLIPNSSRPKLGEPSYKPAFAYIEAWYPEAIPTSAVDSYIITWKNRKKRLFEYQEFSTENVEKLDENLVHSTTGIKWLRFGSPHAGKSIFPRVKLRGVRATRAEKQNGVHLRTFPKLRVEQ
jgi:hypothetical protein